MNCKRVLLLVVVVQKLLIIKLLSEKNYETVKALTHKVLFFVESIFCSIFNDFPNSGSSTKRNASVLFINREDSLLSKETLSSIL